MNAIKQESPCCSTTTASAHNNSNSRHADLNNNTSNQTTTTSNKRRRRSSTDLVSLLKASEQKLTIINQHSPTCKSTRRQTLLRENSMLLEPCSVTFKRLPNKDGIEPPARKKRKLLDWLDRLPEHIWLHVLSCLNKRELLNCFSVSKKFKCLCRDNSLWRSICIDKLKNNSGQ